MKRLLTKIAIVFVVFTTFLAEPTVAVASSLVSYMHSQLGSGRPSGCPSRWCACYLGKSLRASGYASIASMRAVDYRHYGVSARAAVGAIMVMPHHVGVIDSLTRCGRGKVGLVSGNHSHRVGKGCYSVRSAVAFRMPVKHSTKGVKLKAGSRHKVTKSQVKDKATLVIKHKVKHKNKVRKHRK